MGNIPFEQAAQQKFPFREVKARLFYPCMQPDIGLIINSDRETFEKSFHFSGLRKVLAEDYGE